MTTGATNWFDQGGANYARYRPDYPDELAAALAALAPDRRLAVDVGCGNGQFTRRLAEYFEAVVGVDPSADQIAHAVPDARIDYRCAAAEALPLEDGAASLLTAAQAAHWFDLPAFHAEARRIGMDGAAIALVSYGVARLDPGAINDRLAHFHDEDVGPYWPSERHMVENGYADMDFPFPAIAVPAMAIHRDWNAHQLLGYVGTWSAVRRAREAGQEQRLSDFATDLLDLWGDPERQRAISWPISVRAGRLS
ncbi:class I SAM-dependent methyltransferase [Sphingobium sp. BYY-5]|uniref:class I SAM-dependent methyltransferase n=1 Tax=Sphingobium sp. BYY-5 TaxID=2926400 RepID=UPI001FA7FAF6|nr:class I SAM-dependent methyltransferase [Sphingobium sp. BYY-5]MCI4589339.1 class I SAM-dependent methyltransferase [Sphingobium sp. BYY-5]